MMKTSGKIVDDFETDDPIYIDLKFFEHNFGGVMPFEISIDTKKKNGVIAGTTLDKINELQKIECVELIEDVKAEAKKEMGE